MFAARPHDTDPVVDDPDGEISDAAWFAFDDLPDDTPDRETLLTRRNRCL